MKLYSAQLSPFSARARMAIYAADLPVEVLAPPGGGGRSREWLAINPIGKIPALVLDDGTVIPESDTIVEFLADVFADSRLRPVRPANAARARLLARIVDLYLFAAGEPLMRQLDPRARDAAVVDAAMAEIETGLRHLEEFMTEDRLAVGDAVTTADCALVSVLFFLEVFGRSFGKGNPIAHHRKLAGYWSRVRREPAAQRVIGEMQEALRQMSAAA
jgi:glutathione S-transferase